MPLDLTKPVQMALRSDLRLSVSATERETVAINALRDMRQALSMRLRFPRLASRFNDKSLAARIDAALRQIEGEPAR